MNQTSYPLDAIIRTIEKIAPLAYQESYDNSGLIVGNRQMSVSKALLCIDVTEEVIDEAIAQQAELIISHHPLVFAGLKSFTGRNSTERCLLKAIGHSIAIYAAHTNLDNVRGGVNDKIAEKLGLTNCKILAPRKNELRKIVSFVPEQSAQAVRQALCNAGAGHIGNYDHCTFNTSGQGTFRANDKANPFVGQINSLHIENEIRIETIFPKHLQRTIVSALLEAHPYEEVAFDIYPLENNQPNVGLGIVGKLPHPTNELEFLKIIKQKFNVASLRHTKLLNKPIDTVALCGGSGAGFLNEAMAAKADIYISADFKYHQFFDAENKILIADIGHFESEQYTKEIFYEILTKNFINFAVRISEVDTNPVKYL